MPYVFTMPFCKLFIFLRLYHFKDCEKPKSKFRLIAQPYCSVFHYVVHYLLFSSKELNNKIATGLNISKDAHFYDFLWLLTVSLPLFQIFWLLSVWRICMLISWSQNVNIMINTTVSIPILNEPGSVLFNSWIKHLLWILPFSCLWEDRKVCLKYWISEQLDMCIQHFQEGQMKLICSGLCEF